MTSLSKGMAAGCGAIIVLALAVFEPAAAVSSPSRETVRFGHFGVVTLHRSAPHPSHVALLISGDGGWDSTMAGIAEALEKDNTLVVGINVFRYLHAVDGAMAKCAYPSGDFEPRSHFVEKKLGFPEYIRPVLIGYQSGAALAYAVLASGLTSRDHL